MEVISEGTEGQPDNLREQAFFEQAAHERFY